LIDVDDRIGSKELFPLFPNGTARLRRFDYGDMSFVGNGPQGMPYRIGIERKRITDMLSSMASNRLQGHQLKVATRMCHRVYLVIEGVWKCSDSGFIQHYYRGGWHNISLGNREFLYSELLGYLQTIREFFGTSVIQTGSPNETVRAVINLHGWWVSKRYDEHKSHLAKHIPVALANPSLVFRMAVELPGVGIKRAVEVDKTFDSVLEMVNGDVDTWAAIEGVGKVTAKKCVNALQGKSIQNT